MRTLRAQRDAFLKRAPLMLDRRRFRVLGDGVRHPKYNSV